MISSSEESFNTPYGDKLLPKIHTSTQSTRNLVGLKVNHEKSIKVEVK
jgi:hypothetical protein